MTKKSKILVIDDEEVIRWALRCDQMAQRAGAQ